MRTKIGERIKRLREARKWTIRDLEKKSGITNVSISRYETGQNVPRAKVVAQLAKAFGVGEEELLGEASKPIIAEGFDPKMFERKLAESRSLNERSKSVLMLLIDDMLDKKRLKDFHDKVSGIKDEAKI